MNDIMPVPPPAVTLSDRCDRCGAPAKIRVQLLSGSLLDFCLHHLRAHFASLQAAKAVGVSVCGELESRDLLESITQAKE